MIATYRHRLTLRTSPAALESLVAPIGGRQRTPPSRRSPVPAPIGGDR
ncbi:hypothetical protein ACFY4B_22390 [Kitasatospora sp. NPDC001261]